MSPVDRIPRALRGAIVVALAALGAVAAATAGNPDTPHGKPGRYANSVTATGQNLPPDHAAALALAGFATRQVTAASYEASTNGRGELRVTESTDRAPVDGDVVVLTWNAAMIQGATAERMRSDETTLADVLGDARIMLDLPDGKQMHLDPATMGSIAAGQRFGAVGDQPGDKQLTADAQAVLARFGLTASCIEIRHPLGAALVVQASIADDASIDWTIDGLRSALEGPDHNYEGLLISLTSPDGAPRLVAAAAYRTGLGGLWFADGQDARFGAVHGGGAVHG
jgi:hypothetical protein